ncbi:MAG: ABC transporter substrate-binding protein [Prevotellaceae bacterium]|nr:ABC transporter substrate-binding protein [Prevotellaceae bacterium]
MCKLKYFVLCLFATVLCGACGQTDNADDNYDSTALKLGVLPTVECLPFYYADSLGLFDSLGINVQLTAFAAAIDADTAFANGYIDGIVSDLVKACVWNENGDSVHIAMCGDLRMWLVTSQSARLTRAESMKEKIIGITRHSALDFFTDRILESVKFKSIDINKPQINDIRLRTLMIDQNQYDGAILPEPYASEAVAHGARRLNSTEGMKLEGMMCVLFSDSIYKSRKQDIDKIAKVYDMAVDALNEDTIYNVLGFLPQQHIMQMPDTLYTYIPLRRSYQPSDSIMTLIKQWAKGRELIK